MDSLSKRDIKYLKGVGEQRARLLAEEPRHTHFPRPPVYVPTPVRGQKPLLRDFGTDTRYAYGSGERAFRKVLGGRGRCKKRLTALFTDGRRRDGNSMVLKNQSHLKRLPAGEMST